MKSMIVPSFAIALALALLPGSAASADDAPGLTDDGPGLTFDTRGAPPAPARAAAPGEQVVSATATFSPANRVAGMPTSTAPEHQVVMPGGSLSVTVDYGYHWETGALTYHYSLSTDMGAPDPSGTTVVRLGFGVFQGTTCMIEEVTSAYVYGSITDVLLYDDKDTEDLPGAAGWNCAALVVGVADPARTPYDAFVTRLDAVVASPRISLSAPRQERLVKGVWTEVQVEVANAATSQVHARDIRVGGTGKGVKVRSDDVGALAAGDGTTALLWVKLTRPRATVRFTATELGQPVASGATKLRLRPAPAPPAVGSWGSGGWPRFTVVGGRVKNFLIHTRTTCGGYGTIPTYTSTMYDFPTTAIPRNNEVIESDRGSTGGYLASLRLEFVSRTKAKGSFTYSGPGSCRASDTFTVRRR